MSTSITKTGILIADGIGVGENLVPNYGAYNTEENAYVWTTNRTDGYHWLTGSAFEVEPSTTYVYSVCSDGSLVTSHRGSAGGDPVLKEFSMWLYISNDGTTKNWQAGQYDRAQNFNSSNFSHVQEGNRHFWFYTTSATERYMSIRLNTYSDGETNISVKFWGLKFEKGSVPTLWIPNTQYDLYTSSEIGFDEGSFEGDARIASGYMQAKEFYED